jgi:hypothetical protein
MVTFLAPQAEPVELEEQPQLASWDRHDHPSQVRRRNYLEHVMQTVMPMLAVIDGPAALQLDVGLGPRVDLLHQRDLDNYLQPVADVLPTTFCSYWATKSTATVSGVAVAPAVPAGASSVGDWRAAYARITGSLAGTAGREELTASIAAGTGLAPDGPLELQIAFTIGERRNWRALWKPTIDALDPILGRSIENRAFHPRDDRIVRLGLHRNIDAQLGTDTQVSVWWRAATGIELGITRKRLRSARSDRITTRARSGAGISASEGVVVFKDDDPGYEEWLREHHAGYVVNALRNPTAGYLKLHRAACSFISNSNRRGAGWTTGSYIKACSHRREDLARWACRQTGGKLDPGCRCN